MSQSLNSIVIPREFNTPDWMEEILTGSFRAVGRQFGRLVTVRLANRIASANEADEVDELSGFDLLVSKLRSLHSEYFVFDISKVTEIDPAALQHFLGAKSLLEKDGGKVVLAGLPSSDDTLLSDLLTLFPHFSNREQAIQYLQSEEHSFRNSKTGSHSSEVSTGTDEGSTSNARFGSPSSSNDVRDCADSREVNVDDLFNYYSLAD